MKHRKVTNLMVSDVAAVSPDTPFKEIARVLTARGVNGAPVIDSWAWCPPPICCSRKAGWIPAGSPG
jgi:hypothetical protein